MKVRMVPAHYLRIHEKFKNSHFSESTSAAYTSILSKMIGEKTSVGNPPGFIPLFGQGLRAKESQLGAIGTKEWLKSIKLHKYWPLISHWSYWQMLALTEDNIEYNIKMVGGTDITRGALGKLLRSIEELRQRETRLKRVVKNVRSGRTSLESELSYLSKVVHSALPTSEEDFLPTLIVHTIQQIKELITLNENLAPSNRSLIDKIETSIKRNPVLNRAEERLRKMPFLWEFQQTLTNYAIKSSRILPRILRQRNRNISKYSGFEENSSVQVSTIEVPTIWSTGINTVKLELPTGDVYQESLLHSPFYHQKKIIQESRHEHLR